MNLFLESSRLNLFQHWWWTM